MSKRNPRKNDSREQEQKEFDEETLQIDRVTRVVKGGRRMRFRITLVIGDRKGRVGLGIGKAVEVSQAMKKAYADAKKHLLNVPMTEGGTIPHKVQVKHKSAEMMMMPAAPGTGVIAGGAMRKILTLAGVKNVIGKNFRTGNRVVTAQAAMMALEQLRPVREAKKKEAPKEVAKEAVTK
jgi:small subunit ribosomal protein S5